MCPLKTRYKNFVGTMPCSLAKEGSPMSELSKTTPAEPEWVAFAAMDWANQKHFWRLLPAGSQRYEEGELDNTPEAIEVWAANLQRRFGGRPIAVCLEQSRGPLVYTLTKY